jgi:hypothetical protein
MRTALEKELVEPVGQIHLRQRMRLVGLKRAILNGLERSDRALCIRNLLRNDGYVSRLVNHW